MQDQSDSKKSGILDGTVFIPGFTGGGLGSRPETAGVPGAVEFPFFDQFEM